MNHVIHPLHTVLLTDGHYVVSHYGPEEVVSFINQQGAVIATYRNSETTELMSYTRRIVVVNNCILVTDRILLLNSSLSNARQLSLPVNSQLHQSCCMYLDQSRGRLYVGEWSDEGRVLVFDSINLNC